jgi:hypothetical protein
VQYLKERENAVKFFQTFVKFMVHLMVRGFIPERLLGIMLRIAL